MAIPVIVVPAAPIRLRMMTVTVNDFDRTSSALYVQVDAKGEQIKGGIQFQGQVTGDRYDATVKPFLKDVTDAGLQDLIADGLIDKASVVEIVE